MFVVSFRAQQIRRKLSVINGLVCRSDILQKNAGNIENYKHSQHIALTSYQNSNKSVVLYEVDIYLVRHLNVKHN